MIYRLINNENNYCYCEFRQTDSDDVCLTGNLLSVVSCDCDGNPCEYEFITSAYIKWDGCSHMYFYGEDYDIEDGKGKDTNSYYHICGKTSYLDFIRGIAFIYKLAKEVIERCDETEFDSEDILNFVEGFRIEKIEK